MEERDLLSGIAGWLLLPAIGLILNPFVSLFTIYSTFFPVFTGGTWEALTDPASASYIPSWGLLIIFELLTNIALTGFGLWVARLFFNHDVRTPKMFILWIIASILLPIVDMFFVLSLPLEETQADQDAALVARSIFYALLWIPYFLKSKRVRNTFTKMDGVEVVA